MKRFFVKSAFALAALLAVQTSAYADTDKPIAVTDLPAVAQAVLNKNFTKHRIALAKVESDILDKSYDIFFVNGDKVEFDRKGNWTEIVCTQDGVPAELVPAEITKYLNSVYPGVKLVKIERENGRYEAKLANGYEFTFNKKFQVVDIDK